MQQKLAFPELHLPYMIDASIALLREHEPPRGYYGCFSGGKDSIVIKELTRMAGVKATWHYNVTTIDPPELIYFIREHHPDVVWEKSNHGNFFRRMEKKGFPTRIVRWCCEEYKEKVTPRGSVMILGIRAEESPNRAKNWAAVTYHRRTRRNAILPIFGWPAEELWQFIRERKLPYCKLYDEGFHRLGCVGCPMAGSATIKKEFARWPKFEKQWRRGFRRVWEKRTGTLQRDGRPWFGDRFFRGWEEMWSWWLDGKSLPEPRDDK